MPGDPTRGTVMTVLGPIKPSKLGFCHAHEHLFNDNAFLADSHADLILDDFCRTTEELALFRSIGGGCIVDAQPVGCGRRADWLVKASKATGVHIIASTGFHKPEFYPHGHWIHTLAEEKVLDIFLSEARGGMFAQADVCLPRGQITARPGVIKAAVDASGVSGRTAVLLSAAAECARLTGLPLLCHLEMGQFALETMRFLLECGIRRQSIILCHLYRKLDDPSRILRAAETGAYLELDTIGRFKYHGDDEEAQIVLELMRQGYGGRLLLGLDTTRTRMKSYGGSIGLDYIAVDFLPRLRKAGLPEETIHALMHENPARAYSNQY
jgi:predicted metal-dependent phosphotriesterase family hydrolase